MRKIFQALLSVILIFLTSCQFSSSERAELIEDGRYTFIDPKDTVTWLMEHIKAGDVDSIYQVFSPKAKEASDHLREKIEELVEFVRACLKNANMPNRRVFCPLDGAIFP